MLINFSKPEWHKKMAYSDFNFSKGKEELYVSQSFSVWNKPAACEPVKHPKELSVSAFTRGNAWVLSRETSWTQNMQKFGFCLLLQAFVCIFIWKISRLCFSKSDFMFEQIQTWYMLFWAVHNWALYKDVQLLSTENHVLLSAENQTNSLLPPNKQTLSFKCHLRDLVGILVLVRMIPWGGNTAGFPVCSSGTS